MSAEIKILIDSYSQSESLKATNTQLTDMLTKLQQISKLRVDKAKSISQVQDYTKEVQALKQLETQTEKYKQAVDKTTAAEIKLLQEKQKLVQQEEKSAQSKTKSAIEALKLADAEKKSADAAQKAIDKAKRQNDAYGLLSKRHQELKREAQNLAAAYGAESKQAVAAAKAANKLDVQLKAIDAKMGDHRRNVGNYASAFQGLNNVLGQFGIALSAGVVFQGLKSSVAAFVEAEKNARALEFAVKNVGDEGEAAFQKLIKQSEELQATGGVFSDDEIQKAQTQLVNYGLLSDEVEVLMPKILDLATAQGVDLATATDTVIKGINGQTKGLKTVGIDFKNTGDKAENYSIILDKLTKFEGAAADAVYTTEGQYLRLQNRIDDLKEGIGQFLVDAGTGMLDWLDVVTGKTTAYEQSLNRIQAGLQQTATEQQKSLFTEIADSDEATRKIKTKLNLELLDIQLQQARDKIQDLKNQGYAASSDEMTAAYARLNALNKEKIDFQEFMTHIDDFKSKPREFDDGDDDGAGGSTKEKKKKAAKSAREVEYERYKSRVEARNKYEELEKRREFEEEQKILDGIEQRRKENEEIKEAQEEMDFWLWKQKKAADKAMLEEEKRHQEELISHIEEFGNKVNDARLQQSEKALSQIEKDIDKQQDMVDLQRERAIRGQENTLAFEEQKKAELERAAITEQKRQEKIKKQEAYWSLLAAFAKSDGDEAAQKAALEIAEGIAISAAFAEKGGMGEDLKDTTTLGSDGWSKTHGSGDILTMISPKEGILTEQNIAALGGKDAFYDLKWNLENMANNPIPDDVFEKQNESFMNVSLRKVNAIDITPLAEKMDQMIEATKRIEVNRYDIDKWGNLIHTMQKGNSKIVTDKGRFVKPQRNKFIS